MKITNHVTPELLARLKSINDECKAMHLPPPPVAFIDLEVKDKDGKLIEKYTSKSNSWVRNAHNYLVGTFLALSQATGLASFGAGSLKVRNIAGTTLGSANYVLNISRATIPVFVAEASSTGAFGIRVGRGTTAESFEHHALSIPITSGTGTNQLVYSAMAIPVGTYDAGTKTWTAVMTRIFNNNSTADINVTEVCLDEILHYTSTSTISTFMLMRDLLSNYITVPVGAQLTVNITTTYVMPA